MQRWISSTIKFLLQRSVSSFSFIKHDFTDLFAVHVYRSGTVHRNKLIISLQILATHRQTGPILNCIFSRLCDVFLGFRAGWSGLGRIVGARKLTCPRLLHILSCWVTFLGSLVLFLPDKEGNEETECSPQVQRGELVSLWGYLRECK